MTQISAQTKITGVIGWPVEHSLSPPMQNAAMAALGLDWTYVAFPVRPDSVKAAIAGMRAFGIVGLNVTLPHKIAVIPHLDEVDDFARATGAVNTIHNVGGRLIGYNTDAYGFVQSVIADGELMIAGTTVLVLGASGAARAVAAGAASEGAKKVILSNRTREKAEQMGKNLEAAFPETRFEVVQYSESSLAHASARAQIVANATSLGLRPGDALPISPEALGPGQVVFDAVYRPEGTPLLEAAREAGAIAVDGLAMLARQGAKSLRIWSGLEPDEDLMISVLRQLTRVKS